MIIFYKSHELSISGDFAEMKSFEFMIVVTLIGGLGNQMFQYALYSSLQNEGVDCVIDDNEGKLEWVIKCT